MATQIMTTPAINLRAADYSVCELCRSITIARLSTGFFHHDSTDRLEEAAKSCVLCSIISSCLKKDTEVLPDGNPWDERIWIGAIKNSFGQLVGINIFTYDAEGRIRIFADKGWSSNVVVNMLRTSTHLPLDSTAASIISGRPIKVNARCKEIFDIAREWLSDCIANHPECSIPVGQPFNEPLLPARVIEIEDEAKVRLIQTKGQRGRWIALSYCWGKDGSAFLTKQNRSSLEDEISWHTLPQTFRDAIKIAQELGVRYLWIDTLCIVQDCREDWSIQCTRMPSIYSEAALVLAADASPTSRGGILRNRPTTRVCTLDMELDGRVSFAPLFDKDTPEYLDKRGWCFQEEYLGHRRLVFSQTHMKYQCTRRTLTEHGYPHESVGPPRYISPVSSAVRNAGSLDNIPVETPGKFTRIDTGTFYHYWYSAVSDFTLRALTMADDKLPAISGLASRIGECTGDRYLAGLWLATLPQSLLWHAIEHASLLPTEFYRAPSWSWASVDGFIDINMNNHENFDTSCEILEAYTIPRTTNPYGQVRGGYIRLRGPLKQGVVGPTIVHKVYSGRNVHISLLDPSSSKSVGDNSYCRFDTTVVGEGNKVWCLEVQSDSSRGLLLVQTDNEEGEYCRIGVFVLDNLSGIMPDWFEDCEEHVVTII